MFTPTGTSYGKAIRPSANREIFVSRKKAPRRARALRTSTRCVKITAINSCCIGTSRQIFDLHVSLHTPVYWQAWHTKTPPAFCHCSKVSGTSTTFELRNISVNRNSGGLPTGGAGTAVLVQKLVRDIHKILLPVQLSSAIVPCYHTGTYVPVHDMW